MKNKKHIPIDLLYRIEKQFKKSNDHEYRLSFNQVITNLSNEQLRQFVNISLKTLSDKEYRSFITNLMRVLSKR